MKPFKYKNKVSFGDFKSAMEAARAVDVAFYYYDKNKWRNFRDSPRFLPPLPGSLNEEGKLKFVKEQARSLAFMALRLPSTFDPANRCEEYKPSSHPSSGRLDQIETAASDLRANEVLNSDQLPSRRSGPVQVVEIPVTSETLICNHDSKDCFEAIQKELTSQDALSNSEESASELLQQLKAMIETNTQVVVDSQAMANVPPIVETSETQFPEFLDEEDLFQNWQTRPSDPLSCEEHKALDVNDYIDLQVPILEAEHSHVHLEVSHRA